MGSDLAPLAKARGAFFNSSYGIGSNDNRGIKRRNIGDDGENVRLPTKPAMHSNMKPAEYPAVGGHTGGRFVLTAIAPAPVSVGLVAAVVPIAAAAAAIIGVAYPLKGHLGHSEAYGRQNGIEHALEQHGSLGRAHQAVVEYSQARAAAVARKSAAAARTLRRVAAPVAPARTK
jgi:hypothetical protein